MLHSLQGISLGQESEKEGASSSQERTSGRDVILSNYKNDETWQLIRKYQERSELLLKEHPAPPLSPESQKLSDEFFENFIKSDKDWMLIRKYQEMSKSLTKRDSNLFSSEEENPSEEDS